MRVYAIFLYNAEFLLLRKQNKNKPARVTVHLASQTAGNAISVIKIITQTQIGQTMVQLTTKTRVIPKIKQRKVSTSFIT